MAGEMSRPALKKPRARVEIWAACIITGAVYLAIAMSFGTVLENGLMYGIIPGMFALVPAWLISFAIAWLVHRWLGQRKVIIASLAISGALIATALYYRRPIHHFEKFVISPAPDSLSDLRVWGTRGFGGEWGWAFDFKVDDSDFDAVHRAHNLKRVQEPELAERVLECIQSRLWRFCGEAKLPEGSEIYTSSRIVAIHEPHTGQVYMFYYFYARHALPDVLRGESP